MTAAQCFGKWPRPRGVGSPLSARLGALVFVVIVVALPAVGSAQTSVRLRIDRETVSEDDQLTVRVVARGEYDEVAPPQSDGFDFESAGRSSQVSIIGSQMQRSDTYTYVGRPRRIGTHVIEPVKLRLRGRVVARSRQVEVKVTSARSALGVAVAPDKALDMRRYQGEAFFVRPQVSATRPYAGQPFVLSYELFWSRRVHVSNIRELSGPKYTGFEIEDLLGGRPQEQETARFGGAPYFRQMTRKVLLTATTAGKYEVLGPRYRVDAGDIFSSSAYKVGPPPIAIEVRDVPQQGRPQHYQDGNVGRLELDGWLLQRDRPVRTRKAKVGERVVMHVEVRGLGNLYGVSKIEPSPLDGLRIEPLPSRADEHVKTTANGTEGKRVWQYVLTFEAGGRYEIPALRLAAFDPYDEKFTVSTAGPFVVHVDGPTKQVKRPAATGPSPTSAPASGVVTGAADMRPVASSSNPWQSLRPIAAQAKLAQTAIAPWTSSTWFWRIAGAPWFLALLFGLARFGTQLRASGELFRREDSALAEAIEGIEQARLQGGEGYASLRKAIADYLQVRVGLRLAGVTFAALRQRLVELGADEQVVVALCRALERCDAVQYAPSVGNEDMETIAAALSDGLKHLDQVLPKAAQVRSAMIGWLMVGAGCAAILIPGSARAVSVDDAFSAANKAYIASDFVAAKRAYEDLLRHDLPAAAIQYNLANTLVRTGRIGEAIGHYKRALRMEPAPRLAADIQANLKLCREQLAERSRRRHRILHIFDESPEIDVALARAAPRTLLGFIVIAGGFASHVRLMTDSYQMLLKSIVESTRISLTVNLV